MNAPSFEYFFRIKLARQEQTHTMKKERIEAAKVRLQFESLWGLVLMLLAREKQLHGDTMVQGRDGGSDCLKKQGREKQSCYDSPPGRLFDSKIMVELKILVVKLCHDHAVVVD